MNFAILSKVGTKWEHNYKKWERIIKERVSYMSYQERLIIYEQIKAKISALNLSQSEYEKRIKKLADKLKI